MKTIAQQLNVKDFPFEIKDKDGRLLYFEYSDGDWERREYDSNGNERYYKNSKGVIIDIRPSENAESTMILRELFRQIRLGKHNHLGLGDIRLTVAQQDEICYLVESLINKRIDQ